MLKFCNSNKSQRPMYGKRWVLKFSPTWEVEGDLDLLIRESAPPLDKRVRRGEVHARSSSRRASHRVASRFVNRAESTMRFIFAVRDSRIVGYCNRLERETWAQKPCR